MTIDRIRNLRHAEPFQPFSIHLRDGRHVAVRQRDFLALSPGGTRIIVVEPDDSHHSIALESISAVTLAGKSRRGRERPATRRSGHDR